MRRLVPISTLALSLFAAVPVCTQAPPAVDPALFTGLNFRLVGPARGGRVTTVTGVPTEPRTFYMGVASGGVFRTTDGRKPRLPAAPFHTWASRGARNRES